MTGIRALAGMLCLLLPGLLLPVLAQADAARPNVVLIVLDTARADHTSLDDYARATTPNLERLARDAVVYSRAHSVAPWTLPSHMSMFTGQLPGVHGATWRAFAEPADMQLQDVLARRFTPAHPEQLLSVQLKRLGYHTAAFSSNAWVAERTGFGDGFDAFYEMWQEDDDFRKVFKWVPPGLREREFVPAEYRTLSEMDSGDAGLVLSKLAEHAGSAGVPAQPLFLFFNFIDPHYPYSPPLSWRYAYSDDHELGERIAHFEFSELAMQAGLQPVDVTRFVPFYDAEMNYVDAAVGRLLDSLKARGVYDNALIIVTSDHGEHLGEGGRFSHQFSLAEELLRVPLLIKYPHGRGHGSVVDNPLVSNLDVYETILAAADPARPRQNAPLRAQNLADMTQFSRDSLIAEYYYSPPYLRINHEMNPDFSVTANSVVRRVVFDGKTRYEFADPDWLKLMPVAGADTGSAGYAHAAQVLRDYLAGLSVLSGPASSAATMDEATLQRLRSLGYIN